MPDLPKSVISAQYEILNINLKAYGPSQVWLKVKKNFAGIFSSTKTQTLAKRESLLKAYLPLLPS